MIGKAIDKFRYLIQRKAFALSYHRIANSSIDPWQLSVTPAYFEEQLQLLKSKYSVVSSARLLNKLQQHSLSSKEVCITFDDGYRDNYIFAKPLLEKYDCPAVFFIPTHYIDKRIPFWWDELQEIILGERDLPRVLSIKINKEDFYFDLGDDHLYTTTQATEHQGWIWYQSPPTRRCELYLEIWKRIRPLTFNEIQSIIGQVKDWCQISELSFAEIDFPMSYDELVEIGKHPLFEIGIHTVTHPALASHAKDVQTREIVNCKKELEKICHREINTIAYPYGNYNQETLSVVEEIKLKTGFNTDEKIIKHGDDPYQLGRFQVKNWNAAAFSSKLSKWKTGLNI